MRFWVTMAAQVTLATIFATQVVFRIMGRDYDAAMVVGGLFGLGFPLGPGDQELLWTENNATNNKAWDIRRERYNFEIKRVTLPWKSPLAKETLSNFLKNRLNPAKPSFSALQKYPMSAA